MTNYEKMISGKLYIQNDEECLRYYHEKGEFLDEFNATKYNEFEKRARLVKGMFAHVGKGVCISKPFHCDYGRHISVGDNFYANYDCVILDVAPVTIGNNVFLAPKVCIFTAGHPIDKDVRNEALEYGYPVTIGDDVWIGGNTVINPGVTIGSDVVIGSGSVVTKDIPSHVVAAGNPCRVIRPITDEDKKKWQKQREEYYATIEKVKIDETKQA